MPRSNGSESVSQTGSTGPSAGSAGSSAGPAGSSFRYRPLLCLFLLICFGPAVAWSANQGARLELDPDGAAYGVPSAPAIPGTSPQSPAGAREPALEWVDPNELRMAVSNLGMFGNNLFGGGPGLFYPGDTGQSLLFSGGLWLGGLSGSEVRVTIAEYQSEFQPGVIHPDGTWSDPDAPEYRVYKITPDSGPGDPDYDSWPVADGAPVDAHGDPLVAGAQTLWSVFHDADPTHHTNSGGGTDPIGVEVRHLTFAYDFPHLPCSRLIVMDYELHHKGIEPLEGAIAGIFTDIDLGGFMDDLTGSWPALSSAYGYNGAGEDEQYGVAVPAIGVAILEAPGEPARRLYSSMQYTNGTDPNNAVESYNLLRGLNLDGSPQIDPTTGMATRHVFPGDPITGEGWIDIQPGDKRTLLGVGPFDFLPGHVERLRVAVLVGQGNDRLESVEALEAMVRSTRDLSRRGAFPVPSVWALAGVFPRVVPSGFSEDVVVYLLAPEAGHVSIRVLDEVGTLIRNLESDLAVEPGILPILWDWTDNTGSAVPPGDYRFVLRVPGSTGIGAPGGWNIARVTIVEPEPLAPLRSPRVGSGDVPRLIAPPIISCRGCWIELEGHPVGRARASLTIYNVLGRPIRTIQTGRETAGRFWWDGRDDTGKNAPSGLYLIRYEDETLQLVGRTVLVR